MARPHSKAYRPVIYNGDVNVKCYCKRNVTVGDTTTASGLNETLDEHTAALQALGNQVELGEFNSSADIASSPSSGSDYIGQLKKLVAERDIPFAGYFIHSHALTYKCTAKLGEIHASRGRGHYHFHKDGFGSSKIIAKTEAAKNMLEFLIEKEYWITEVTCITKPYKSRFLKEFESIKSLGDGGYGRVFEAKNKKDGRRYAIKQINLDESDISEDELWREVGALAKLDHPNTVRYHNAWVEHPIFYEYMVMKNLQSSLASASRDQNSVQGRSDSTDDAPSDSVTFRNSNAHEPGGVDQSSYSDIILKPPINLLFIQMELCSVSLKDWLIKKAPQVDHRSKLKVFQELLSAVVLIHRKGLIHRDIKPGNIFLSEDDHIKLGDFGLVRFHDKANNAMEQLSPVGTVTYRSPEQVSGRYDHKADIYPLGLILLEMCVPITSTHQERIETLLSARDGNLPQEFEQNFPEEYQLVRKMTETEPARRPQAIDLLNNSLFKGLNETLVDNTAALQALDTQVELGEFNSSADIASSPSSGWDYIGQLEKEVTERGYPFTIQNCSYSHSSHGLIFRYQYTIGDISKGSGKTYSIHCVGIGGSDIIARTETAKKMLRSLYQEENRIKEESYITKPYKSRIMTDFELKQSLGEGGYGTVFQAKHITDGRDYAIKQINLDECDMPVEKSMREVEALAQLDHLNIVRYFSTWVEHLTSDEYMEMKDQQSSLVAASRDQNSVQFPLNDEGRSVSTGGTSDSVVFRNNNAVTSDESSSVDQRSYSDTDYTCSTREKDQSKANLPPINLLFIQMELCSGTLKDWLIKKAPQVDHRSKLKVFRELLSAVEFIHRKGFIHRDIKPGNIFLSEDDQIKLGDFGLVRFHDKANNAMEQLSLVGTVSYMSPEQGSGRYDHKADIYPLGLILLEMCVPIASHHERSKTLLSARDGNLPQEFEQNFHEECQLVREMTETDPERRPQAIDLLDNPLFKDI